MATAEQNALLALQLFAPGTERLNQLTDNRIAQVERLKLLQQQQGFAQQQQDRAFDQQTSLETMRDTRAVNAENARLDRELSLNDQRSKLAEQRAIEMEIAKAYPVYAKAAVGLGQKPKPVETYAKTIDGLLSLGADAAEVAAQADKAGLEASAMGFIGMLDAVKRREAVIANQIKNASEFNTSDRASIRQAGLRKLQEAFAAGELKDVKDKAFNKAYALLDSDEPNFTEAAKLLGSPNALAAYKDGASQYAVALANSPEKKAQIIGLQRQAQEVERSFGDMFQAVASAGVKNPYLGRQIASWMQQNPQTYGTVPQPQAQPNIESLFRGLPDPARTAPAQPAPEDQGAARPGLFMRSLSALGSIGGNALQSVPGYQATRDAVASVAPTTVGALQSAWRPINNALPSLPDVSPEALVARLEQIARQGQPQPQVQPQTLSPTELDRLRSLFQQSAIPAGQAPIVPNAPLSAARTNPNFLQNAALLQQTPLY